MNNIYPSLSNSQLRELNSKAEATIYTSLKNSLDDNYIVIYSSKYITKCKDNGHKDGESDFVIFSSKDGLLTIEVKGGGIKIDPSYGWSSIDSKGIRNSIKDPFEQAKNEKFNILNQLKDKNLWKSLKRRIPMGHAVLFPDIDKHTLQGLSLSECNKNIVGSKQNLNNISDWIDDVFKYWRGDSDISLGEDGLKIIYDIFCKPISILPLLRDKLIADEKVRITLTNEQASILRTLERHKRAGIVGAAGTGKTVLAVEQARKLLTIDNKVLLLCYNKPLSVMLSKQFLASENILVCSFHQFCSYCIDYCKKTKDKDCLINAKEEYPNDDIYDIQLPFAAANSIEYCGDALQFDAIIIDEGQDFGEEFWLPIELALKDPENSWLYIFYDENQKLYSRVSSFPLKENDSYILSKNCRNTKPVHELAYRFYGGEAVTNSDLEGDNPIPIIANNIQAQCEKIFNCIFKLVKDEKIKPESIAILVANDSKEFYYDTIKNNTAYQSKMWSFEEHYKTNTILVDTARRFKGLERDIIFLWVSQDTVIDETLMYVGISRAKSIIYIIGDERSIKILGVS